MDEQTGGHTNLQFNMAPLETPKNFSYNAYMHLGSIPSSNANSETLQLSMNEEKDKIRREELDAIAMFRLHVYYPVRLKSFSKKGKCNLCQRDVSICSCHLGNLMQDRRTSIEVNELHVCHDLMLL